MNLTDRDGYWGAKMVGSFTDEQIRDIQIESPLNTDDNAFIGFLECSYECFCYITNINHI